MMSPTSGYVTVKKYVTAFDFSYNHRFFKVPRGHVLLISFQKLIPLAYGISIYHHYQIYDHSLGQIQHHFDSIWGNDKYETDFAGLFNVSEILIAVHKCSCNASACFRLNFSFLPLNATLRKMESGRWNCSVLFYPRIAHHLACNLKTECEDGRDEGDHCPYSSAQCQGMVALCDRCYTFVKSPSVTNAERGSEYCQSLGGKLGFPKCLNDWYATLKNMTGVHPFRLDDLLTGLFINDMSLPSEYSYVIVAGRTALYHSVVYSRSVRAPGRKCLATEVISEDVTYWLSPCHHVKFGELAPRLPATDSSNSFFGMFCEFERNDTEGHSPLHPIFLPLTLQANKQSITVCNSGHVTHNFFICGSDQYTVCKQQQSAVSKQSMCRFETTDAEGVSVPAFQCHYGKLATISFTLVCDYVDDCRDKSDELLCEHPACVNTFTCSSEQCVTFDLVCDLTPHCLDRSDERDCYAVKNVMVNTRYFPSPALVSFDGVRQFDTTPMKSNESCPDSHYRCPGEFNDCLPVFTLCNGVHDCVDHQDEVRCEEMTCPGFFRCRATTTCVHSDYLCDGWSHCPLNDDELVCGMICPVTCQCQGHAFACHQPFNAALFSQIRYLDGTGSGMKLSDVSHNAYLIHVVLRRCSLTSLPEVKLLNVRLLDLGDNELRQVNVTSFIGLKNLQVLSLSNNPLTSLCSSSLQQNVLSDLDLSFTTLTVFDADILSAFPALQRLNLTFTSVHTISTEGFRTMSRLTELHMEGSPVEEFPPDLFQDLFHLSVVSAGNYKLCCKAILPQHSDSIDCHAPKDEMSSCEDLLQSWTYRVFLWLTTCLSLTGNVFCFCSRFFAKSMTSSSSFSVFVIHLTMADFLMGVYSAVIGAGDERYRGIYFQYDDTWKSSAACRAAGCLSLLSSEVSALIIGLITLDRFVVLRFPFSTLRFEKRSAMAACLVSWLGGWCLAVLPLLPVTNHWEFYSQTGICIPLPVTRQQFKGKMYSFAVMIVFNFALFLIISFGQLLIYRSIQTNTFKSASTKMSRDMTIARRLITVAVTDFLCWFPIGLCGILAQAGVPIPGKVNVALAVFVLPLNSAVNPFVYTLHTLAEKRSKMNEAKFLTWLESHADLV